MRPHLHSPRGGLPGTAAARFTPSVSKFAISLIMSDEEEVESIWCVGVFFVFFYQFVSRFCLWNWSTSICHFYWLFDLSSARCFHCLLVGQPESVMSSVGCLLCGTREPDLLDAALSQKLIQTVACWVELVRKCFGIIIIKVVAVSEEASRAFIQVKVTIQQIKDKLNVKGSKWASNPSFGCYGNKSLRQWFYCHQQCQCLFVFLNLP